MARRKSAKDAPVTERVTKRRIIETVSPQEPAYDPADYTDSLSSEMQSALAQVREDQGYIVIKRRIGDTGQFGWLKRVEPADFSVQAIGEIWGGGEYLLLFYDGDGQQIQKSVHFVDPAVKGRESLPVMAGATSDTAALFAMMSQQLSAAQERHETLLKLILDKQPTEEKVIEKLKLLKEVVGGSAPATMSPDTVLQMVMKGMEIAAEARESSADTSPGLMGLLEKAFAPVITQIVQRYMQPAPPTTIPPVLLAPPPARTPAPASNGGTNVEEPMSLVQGYVFQHLPLLLMQASRGSDPALYAELIVDNCPPSLYAQALTFLNRPTLIEELTAKEPQVAAHREWFVQVQVELVGFLQERLKPVMTDAPRQPVSES